MVKNLNDIWEIDPQAQTRHIKKGQLLLKKGDETSSSFFVVKGLLRSYIIDSKGKEHIFAFAPEGWILADMESMEFHLPSGLYIDSLEDTELVVFNKNAIMESNVPRETVLKNLQLLYRRLGILQRRIIMQMSAPAIDRYTYFLEMYPQLPNRVPQYMIASYLGITPQALSTLRAQQ